MPGKKRVSFSKLMDFEEVPLTEISEHSNTSQNDRNGSKLETAFSNDPEQFKTELKKLKDKIDKSKKAVSAELGQKVNKFKQLKKDLLKKKQKKDGRKQSRPMSKFEKSIRNDFKVLDKKVLPQKLKAAGSKRNAEKPLSGEPEAKTTKTDWKEYKAKMKLVREERRKKKSDLYELSHKAKLVWEVLRREDTTETKRTSLCRELYKLIKDNLKGLIYAHDTVRVIETLFSSGDAKIQSGIFEELKSEILNMSKSKYANHLVKKILDNGTKEQKSAILSAFAGHAVRLITNRKSSEVLELAYNDWANAKQRQDIIQEFYDTRFRYFKDDSIKGLGDLIEKHPENRVTYLQNLRDVLTGLMDKNMWKHSLIHALVLEYLLNCDPKDRSEMIVSLRDGVAHMLHTRDGSRIGMNCFWHGTAKDKKEILKTFKKLVPKICKEEHGHMVLMALFDSIDDTVLVEKIIFPEIISSFEEIAMDEHGRKVVMYIVGSRNTTYTHPQVISLLEKGDSNSVSKKAKEVRQKELLKAVSAPFLNELSKEPRKWICCSSASIVANAILQHCYDADAMSNVLKAFTAEVTKPFVPSVGIYYNSNTSKKESTKVKPKAERDYDVVKYLNKVDSAKKSTIPEDYNVIENKASFQLLRKMVLNDKVLFRNVGNEDCLFCLLALKNLSDDVLSIWFTCHKATLLILYMFETEIEPVVQLIKSRVKPHVNTLKKHASYFPGSSSGILINKLSL